MGIRIFFVLVVGVATAVLSKRIFAPEEFVQRDLEVEDLVDSSPSLLSADIPESSLQQRGPASLALTQRIYLGVHLPRCEHMQVEACQVFDMTNRARIQRNIPPLRESKRCNLVALDRARQWAQAGTALNRVHRSPAGELPDQTARRYGLHAIAENAAFGYETAEEVMTAWRRSGPHWRGLLNKSYTHSGIAHSGTYWFSCFSIEKYPQRAGL